MTTEKYFDSNADFILYDVTGRTDVVTEQMTAYPQIDLTDGDLKQAAYLSLVGRDSYTYTVSRSHTRYFLGILRRKTFAPDKSQFAICLT
jgi:hypothetical protein